MAVSLEWLKEHLGDDLYNQVVKKLDGNDKVKLANLATGEYVGKDKFTAAETAKQTLEGQIKERDTQLETLKKAAGDNEALKTQIAQLQGENATAKTNFEKQLKATQLDFALESRLMKDGAVNTRAVKALLDMGKISLDGENLVGIDDQLSALKEKEKWAFKPVTAAPGAGGNPAPTSGDPNKKPIAEGQVIL